LQNFAFIIMLDFANNELILTEHSIITGNPNIILNYPTKTQIIMSLKRKKDEFLVEGLILGFANHGVDTGAGFPFSTQSTIQPKPK
jgi:hypothetical protein